MHSKLISMLGVCFWFIMNKICDRANNGEKDQLDRSSKIFRENINLLGDYYDTSQYGLAGSVYEYLRVPFILIYQNTSQKLSELVSQ